MDVIRGSTNCQCWLLQLATDSTEVCMQVGLDFGRRKLIEIVARYSDDLDSLDQLELLMEAEDLLEFSIPDAAAEQMRTPRDVIEWLVGRRG